MKVDLIDGHAVFELQYHENHMAKSCGARWHPGTRRWKAKATRLVASAILSMFPHEVVDPAIARIAGTSGTEIPPIELETLSRGIVGLTLKNRQIEGVMKAWFHRGFAFLWVMGAGKTVSTLALANARYNTEQIDQLLIVCPTSIKGVWAKEVARYSAVKWDVCVMESGKPIKWSGEGPKMLVVGTEAMSTSGPAERVYNFINGGRTMAVVDESSGIKNHDKIRSKNITQAGQECSFRLILSGTSVTQGVHDLFSQFFFVDPCIIGELSYYSFRNKYCVMGGYEQRKIIGHRNVDELLNRLKPYSDTILKDEMPLPPKIYMTRTVSASTEQKRACKELVREMETIIGDKTLSAKNSLEVLLRLQQIAGGFDHEGMPLPGGNPKMKDLLGLLQEVQGKVIIWARYIPEVHAITTAIDAEWSGSVVSMTGDVAPAARQLMVDSFQKEDRLRFFVANQQTAGKGLTITAATTTIYYSNTFSLEDRLQSEDRNHRMGQEHTVTYIDLLSDLKVDSMIAVAVENKRSMADYVGHGLRVKDLV